MVRNMRGAALTLLALFALAACGGNNPVDNSGKPADNGTVIVGSANFTENVLLAEIYAGALEAKGIKVERKLNIGSREVIYKQLESGGLSVLPEYNGALLSYLDKQNAAATTADVNTALKAKLPAAVELLDSAKAEDKDSVTVTKETAAKYNLKSISDLAPVAKDLVIGGPPEFKTRRQGIVGLKDVYGLDFKEFKSLDVAGPVTVSALKKDDIQAANLFTTDPALEVNGFVSLDDPKALFGAQNVTPLVNKAAVGDKARTVLNSIAPKLDTATLTQLMRKVAVDKQDPDKVAKEWLKSVGLA
ncbi:glycine/betaine ABC transporter substrate-binding protein [Longispora fulva]|uniref:Osmoprotectant transport system substrate-binding protein n=1 Tax=Longispora fulva TaxID=619741 RepID=A0A8J7GJL1_9ACTN|nr:ABC transporter substrate-binding protein [Longispora fulva]MBG6141633.1 osmoprotectant transport system substrate-binding protein [Longispora fulva]GIG59212.1 glycine/betaine ABC transporter substrate-binding protein [Longispora fulva]